MKKIINKNIYYNLLSLFNISIAFFFTILLGKKFGIGEETDIYFTSISIITIIGAIVKATWEAFSPDFIKAKLTNRKSVDELYSILLNNVIIISFFIIILFYILTNTFNIINNELKNFLNIFILYLLLQNILYYNKTVLNLEHYYGLYYSVDIMIYMLSIMLISIIKVSINDVAIIFLVTTTMGIFFQFYIIFKKLDYKYIFKFKNTYTKTIQINSFKYRTGTLIYSLKDLLILYFFNNMGVGYYSLFSYANKFAMTISQIVNAPIVNIFITKLNYLVGEKDYSNINKLLKNVLFQTIPLFLIFSIILYLMLPFVIKFFLTDITNQEIKDTLHIFLLLIFFNFIVVIETPFLRSLIIFKEFNFCLYTNIIFIILFSIGFLLSIYLSSYYSYILYILIFTQLINSVLYYKRYVIYLKGKI